MIFILCARHDASAMAQLSKVIPSVKRLDYSARVRVEQKETDIIAPPPKPATLGIAMETIRPYFPGLILSRRKILRLCIPIHPFDWRAGTDR